MRDQDSHLSDEQLLLELEGEVSGRLAKQIRAHVGACWTCRARRQELERAIADFVRINEPEFHAKLPPVDGPRALLKAQIAQISSASGDHHQNWHRHWLTFTWATGILAVCILGFFLTRSTIGTHARKHPLVVSIPDSSLTPGATILENPRALCAQSNTNNKAVPILMQRQVFEEYGIFGADPRAYEVDYLVTPALGGADDIRNLWPHSHSATVWNAEVKDELEKRLREMVCDGSLDLTQAQREISADWIGAYKKYFHTNQPLTPR